jgi:uncharacterized protein (DUF58 family)
MEAWSAGASLRSRVAARLGFVTSLGWIAAGAALAEWIVGNHLGWEELDLGAAGLFLALAVAALFTLGRAQLAVELTLARVRVTVGENAVAGIRVANVGKHRLLPLPVDVAVGEGIARFELPALSAGAVYEDAVIIPTDRRSVIPLGPARSVRSDPLGLLRREAVFADAVELFVHPSTVRLEPMGWGLLRDLEGSTTDAMSVSDLAFHSLRPYEAGDDRRHVHWKTTARLANGDLMVRQFLDTRRSHVVVLVDGTRSSYADDDEFELAVSAAASFTLSGVRGGQAVSVVPGRRTLTSAPGTTALDAFSRMELADRALEIERLGAFAASLSGDASLVVVVSGSVAPLESLRRATRKFDLDTATIAVAADRSQASSLKRAGALRLIRLAQLHDLPRLAVGAARL